MDDNEIASGDISILGIELNLFEATYANELAEVCVRYNTFFWTDPVTNIEHYLGDYRCSNGPLKWVERRMYW